MYFLNCKGMHFVSSNGFQTFRMLVKCVKDSDAVTQHEVLSDHRFVAHLCAFLRLTVVTTPSQNKAIS